MKKFIFIAFLFLTSCLGTKSVSEKTADTKSVEKTKIKNDSVSSETVNKGINDQIIVEVPVSDPAIDAKINEVLRKLNTQKSSGDNSYKLYFDEELRQIRAEFEVAETRNKEVATNSQASTEKTFEQTITENTKKVIRMIPWWGWVIIAFLLRKQIIGIIAIFIPQVKGIKTIADLLTPPNKD